MASVKSFTVKPRQIIRGEHRRLYEYSNELGRNTPLFQERIVQYLTRLKEAGYKLTVAQKAAFWLPPRD
jgi:hypothetical protein